jgi:uncharacterized membrane protein
MDKSQNDLEAIRQLLAELTARVYRIERKLGMQAQPEASASVVQGKPAPAIPTSADSELPPPKAPYPLVPPPPKPSQQLPASDPQPEADLESRIGSHWLNRIGITALLIGISYFLKFAFDNNWIGPAGRVAIGLMAGIGIVIWSERFRAKGYQAFSYSLKAVGIGALYLSLWAAFQVYRLVPSGLAFAMMLAVTAATAAMALARSHSQAASAPRSCFRRVRTVRSRCSHMSRSLTLRPLS